MLFAHVEVGDLGALHADPLIAACKVKCRKERLGCLELIDVLFTRGGSSRMRVSGSMKLPEAATHLHLRLLTLLNVRFTNMGSFHVPVLVYEVNVVAFKCLSSNSWEIVSHISFVLT